jgi:hypothetical protein
MSLLTAGADSERLLLLTGQATSHTFVAVRGAVSTFAAHVVSSECFLC